LAAQSIKPAMVRVIDDCSDEPLPTAWLSQFELPVRTYRLDRRFGPAGARNVGLADCAAPFVAFLDADDEWLPSKAAAQLSMFAADPECVLVFCRRQWIGPTGLPLATTDAHPLPEGEALMSLVAGNSLQPSMVMLRRGALNGMCFDPQMWYAEDWDFWIRLARVGPFRCVHDPLVRYRWHGANSSRRARAMYAGNERVLLKVCAGADSARVKALARRPLRQVRNTLAHLAFEDGDWREARRYFWRAPVVNRATICRGALSSLPPPFLDRFMQNRQGRV